MRTYKQLKIVLTGVLIALATLRIVIRPAQVEGAGQSESSIVAALQDAPELSLAPDPQGDDSAGHHAVSHLDTTRRDDRAMSPDHSLSFLPAVTYDSGGYIATAVTVGDVNGDGKLDLVTAN